MKESDWKYYNHAIISACAPHVIPDMELLVNRRIWKMGKYPLFVRWTEKFDCEEETQWWYVIKDSSFDILKLKSKRRYEINKGLRNFDVKRINVEPYLDELYSIELKAWNEYPLKYRPKVDETEEKNRILNFKEGICFAAFSKEDNSVCGFAYLDIFKDYADFVNLKVLPECEKKGINAAIVYGILDYFNEMLEQGFYICDGSRALFHETAFQDYLEKYFGFRKAYCYLKIEYRPIIKIIVYILYPLRGIFRGKTKIGAKIKTVMEYEEIIRMQEKIERE